MNAELVWLLVVGYFLGSVPFGVLIARAKGVDILSVGSRNPGATNIKRFLGLKTALLVFLLDVAKGAVPALLGRYWLPDGLGALDGAFVWMLAGLAAVLGHCASPFLRFRGGKGIATSLGAGLAAAPVPALLAFAVFGVLLKLTRYVSLASMVGISTTLGWAFLPGQSRQLLPIYLLLSAFIVIRHIPNIRRLLAGTESRFTLRGQTSDHPGGDERPTVEESNAT